jgi:hypothetical protein
MSGVDDMFRLTVGSCVVVEVKMVLFATQTVLLMDRGSLTWTWAF